MPHDANPKEEGRAKAAVDRMLGAVLVALMGLSVLNVLWQVFTRFVLGNPSSFTEELARYLLIWIGVLGAGYALGQNAHLALELLPDHLAGRRRRVLGIAIEAFIAIFAAAVLVVGGGSLVYVQLRLGQTSPSMGIPLGVIYLALPLSGCVMLFYSVLRLRRQMYLLRHGTPVGSESASEEQGGLTEPPPRTEKPIPPE